MEFLKLRSFAAKSPVDVVVGYHLAGNLLELQYQITGAIERVNLPPLTHAEPVRGFEIWKHTCFEAFLFSTRDSTYIELNFSSSGHWDVLWFTDYRAPVKNSDPEPISVHRHSFARRSDVMVYDVEMGTDIAGDYLLCPAMIAEDRDGGQHYYALAHPQAKPDFHRRILVKDSGPLLRFPTNDDRR